MEENPLNKLPLVIITGPTASGKSGLSVELAKRLSGEIISADSMQVYRGMDIGTAKIAKEEMQGVPHHLIDILEPSENFNVFDFKTRSENAVNDITARGKLPIVAGGTGFYIQALLYDVDFTENDDHEEIRSKLQSKNPDELYEMLKETDPDACSYIHRNNVKRVIRALEYFELTGQKISEHNAKQHEHESRYNSAYFVLNMDRDLLYERIDKRVDAMFEAGLVSEVKRLKDLGLTPDNVSMKGLGYKELFDYLDGKATLEEAVYTIKRDTKHFAKRQLTWFRREREVIWLDAAKNREEVLEEIIRILKERQIIYA